MPTPDHRFITAADGLPDLVAALQAAPWVAFDTESNSMFVYRERVCLMQFNAGGALFLLDPFDIPPDALAPVWEPLSDPAQPLYLHGGAYDVAVMKRQYGVDLGGVWDTQQAAVFLGFQRTGYGSLLEGLLDVSLAKSHQQYDWGQRPLSASALRYALDDVVYLPTLVDVLTAVVAEADIAEEVALSCRAIEETAAHDVTFEPARMYRLKGVRDLDARGLSVLTALYAWRDAVGEQVDQPPARFFPNDLLVSLARRAPTDPADVFRGGKKRLLRYADGIAATIAAALEARPTPPPRPRKAGLPQDARKREESLRAWRKREAKKRGLSDQVILATQSLAYLASQGAADLEAVPQLGPGRIARYGDAIKQICSG